MYTQKPTDEPRRPEKPDISSLSRPKGGDPPDPAPVRPYANLARLVAANGTRTLTGLGQRQRCRRRLQTGNRTGPLLASAYPRRNERVADQTAPAPLRTTDGLRRSGCAPDRGHNERVPRFLEGQYVGLCPTIPSSRGGSIESGTWGIIRDVDLARASGAIFVVAFLSNEQLTGESAWRRELDLFPA